MRSQLSTWVIIGLCLVAVLGAMGWITLTVTRLDAAEQAARRETARQEHIRLAMWRLEARATALIANGMGSADPAPVATRGIRQHRRVDLIERAVSAGMSDPAMGAVAVRAISVDRPSWWPLYQSPPSPEGDEQPYRDHLENESRRQHVIDQIAYEPHIAADWDGDDLLLAVATPATVDVFSIDAQLVARELDASVHDLLPDARVLPQSPDEPGAAATTLYSLPLRLDPGDVTFYYERPLSPIRLMLLIAWSCILLPAVGVVVLLIYMATLSERRATFVSAVTHELRTPLTTFRMYTDMLADGMVPPERQPAYIQTLQREADRLSHLVDNVLTYARLERGRAREVLADVRLGDLLDRAEDSLRTHASRATMDLQIDVAADTRDLYIHVDAAAVDRILLNLVDNACKYAADAEDRRILLTAADESGALAISVRDHGPGLPPGTRLAFRPFKKLRDADQQKPGIGLGLALCRRLAERMHGDLTHTPATPGVTFTLTVPLAD